MPALRKHMFCTNLQFYDNFEQAHLWQPDFTDWSTVAHVQYTVGSNGTDWALLRFIAVVLAAFFQPV